ncbi:ArsR/SmtB family transcription factor [Pelagibacterium montanilacus]|uniref:ArsR/SmtB family transcription factor n=1 Tax=Pelagibacterium montanilacus TaxID=2185280 RepID=UPI000F8CE482|nr:metalloregulator ArsR/SmtB family transcription factor [Pelagibacterium montanilacus]
MDTNDALDAFGALASPTRLDIFRALVSAEPEGISAGRVAELLGGRQNTVSAHLAALSRAGLIVGERDGRTIVYRARMETVASLVSFLLEDCCGGRPEICRPVASALACLQPAPSESRP